MESHRPPQKKTPNIIITALESVDNHVKDNELTAALQACNETLTLIAISTIDNNEANRYISVVNAKVNAISKLAEVANFKNKNTSGYSPTLTKK